MYIYIYIERERCIYLYIQSLGTKIEAEQSTGYRIAGLLAIGLPITLPIPNQATN